MRARTELERRVEALAPTLGPLTEAQHDEALHMDGTIYAGRHRAWCSACGGEWETEVAWGRKRARCPHCGRTAEVVKSPNKSWMRHKYYVHVPTVCGEFQVIRGYIVDREVWRDGRSAVNTFCEVFQHWVRPDGVDTIRARRCRPLSYYIDLWAFDSEMELRRDHDRYYPGGYVSTRQRLIPTLRRNGLRRIGDGAPVMGQVREALCNPFAEMLLKNGRREEFDVQCSWWHKWTDTERVALRICVRHGYRLRDVGMWRDYVGDLVELGLDIHNPFYVCPADLRAAHDRMQRRVEAKLKAEREREEREEAERDRAAQESYVERVGRFFAIVLEDGDLTVEPLRSIDDFIAEAEAMHHCVLTNKYYAKDDCLILSARIGGERAATLEVAPREGRILQCQAACNQRPAQYDRIVKLVSDNMGKIQRCG